LLLLSLISSASCWLTLPFRPPRSTTGGRTHRCLLA